MRARECFKTLLLLVCLFASRVDARASTLFELPQLQCGKDGWDHYAHAIGSYCSMQNSDACRAATAAFSTCYYIEKNGYPKGRVETKVKFFMENNKIKTIYSHIGEFRVEFRMQSGKLKVISISSNSPDAC